MLNKSFLAFALLHISVPAICILYFGASSLWVVGSLLFAAATVRTLHETDSPLLIGFLCLLSGVAFVLGLMLGTCFYMQGEGFNEAFFYHLSPDSIVIAARTYASVFYPSLLGLVLAILGPAIISRTQTHKIWQPVPMLALWVLALVSNYPVYSLASYQAGLSAEPGHSNFDMAKYPAAPVPRAETSLEPGPRKNIILIYAESLEALYFDTDLFGDIVPNIRHLSGDAHRFTNLVQTGGTGWTIAGIIASQCGFPLEVGYHMAHNSTIVSVENPYPDQTCLADILSANGYETVYMGGAPLWFAGKKNFLSTHGYQKISGYEELTPRLPDKEYHSGWGVYDDSLFKMALDDLQLLEASDKPYLLTLLTLDTHHPKGLPSKSCKKLTDNDDPMSNSVYCSDQLVSGFIREAMNIVDMDETIIVLFSDHLSLRNTLWDKLKENKQRRRLTFMVFDDRPPTVSNRPATHFDVAPTMLEAAGFNDQTRLGAGVSLFSSSPKDPSGKRLARSKGDAPVLLKSSVSARESGVVLSRRDLSLSFGDLVLKANNDGREFVSGIFLAVLDDAGNVTDTVYTDNYKRLAKNLDGAFIIGIAVDLEPPHSAVYFYGNVSLDGKGITQHVFNDDVSLSPTDIWGSQE